jgi:hypothetical protein
MWGDTDLRRSPDFAIARGRGQAQVGDWGGIVSLTGFSISTETTVCRLAGADPTARTLLFSVKRVITKIDK